ncbi:HNH endonuclease [Corynebacterium suedekumii]|nr:HNH endonuclease [Corynebacterium suedekumii]
MESVDEVSGAVDDIAAGLERLSAILAAPDALPFRTVAPQMERLENALAAKAFIDASFAWAADQSDAGRLVGATRALDYLMVSLGLSRAEALDRLNRGRDLFARPTVTPPPAPAPEPDETEEQRRAREEELARIRAEEQRRLEAEREAQERARDEARSRASAEKQRIIQQELRSLSEHSTPGRAELLAQALAEAKLRAPEDLRQWVRDRVRLANSRGRKADGTRDLYAATKKRMVSMSKQDADGECTSGPTCPPPWPPNSRRPLPRGGAPASTPPSRRRRTNAACRPVVQTSWTQSWTHTSPPETWPTDGAVGSVVVSMTAADVDTLSADDRFATNTGHLLSPVDILQLGMAQYDIGVVHDADGLPLHLARTRRSASLAQRLALFARELCCTRPDCTEAHCDSDVHHLVAWAEAREHRHRELLHGVPSPPR